MLSPPRRFFFALGLNLKAQIHHLLAKLCILSTQPRKLLAEVPAVSLVVVAGPVLAIGGRGLAITPIPFGSHLFGHDVIDANPSVQVRLTTSNFRQPQAGRYDVALAATLVPFPSLLPTNFGSAGVAFRRKQS